METKAVGDRMTPFYERDGIVIYCGDCLEVIPGLMGGFIVTDPPYNIGFKYDVYQDNLPDDVYIEMLCEFQRFRVAIIQYPEEMQRLVVPALGPPDHCSVWCYNSNTPRRFRLINWYGVIPDYSRIKQPYKNPTDKRVSQLIANGSAGSNLYEWWNDIPIVKNVSEEKTGHPCPVPEALMERIIILGSNRDDLIIDPFCGSGTTAKVAQGLGRQFVGCEISEDYCRIAVDRLRQPSFFSLPLMPKPEPKSEQAAMEL